ncbi:MAG: hypothetical protein GXP62_10975 [Oligoflexia bacterium]|nr:hypothetical protein [Oligoflexia bacterium]
MESKAITADFSGSVRRDADALNVSDWLFGLRHLMTFRERDGLPLGADNGHWATGDQRPGLSLELIDGRTCLIVRVVGREPAELDELNRWFGRCYAAIQDLELQPE